MLRSENGKPAACQVSSLSLREQPKAPLAGRLESLTADCRRHLERAFEIGNFRRTGLDDGNIARILWKQASVLSDSPLDASYKPQEIAEKRDQAQLMRAEVEKNTGARIDLHEPDEEVAYDKLVCGYFR